MNAQESPPSTVEGIAAQLTPATRARIEELSPLLTRAGLNIAVHRGGLVEVRNPLDAQMRQHIALGDHNGETWWFWVWSPASNDVLADVEPICPAADLDQAAERLAAVLRIDELTGAEQ